MKDVPMKTRITVLFLLALAGITSATSMAQTPAGRGDAAAAAAPSPAGSAGAPGAPATGDSGGRMGATGRGDAAGAGRATRGGGMGGGISYGKKPTIIAPASPTKAPDADGFIQRWLILEPIAVSGQLGDNAVKATVKTEYFPNQLSVIPRDGDKITYNGADYIWHAVDTTNFNVDLMHYSQGLGKRYENVVFWCVTVIDSPREIPNVRLAIGCNAASAWWFNGQEVITMTQNRQSVPDDGVSKLLTLKKGPNVIRAASINSSGAIDISARILGPDEKPLKDFTINLGVAQ
jgi:hypothetical protein